MKSKNKKQKKGKPRSTLYSPKSKGRKGPTQQTVCHEGWMAHQNVRFKLVWVCNNKGKKMGEFMVEELLTAEQLKEYIKYCQKYCRTEEDVCL